MRSSLRSSWRSCSAVAVSASDGPRSRRERSTNELVIEAVTTVRNATPRSMTSTATSWSGEARRHVVAVADRGHGLHGPPQPRPDRLEVVVVDEGHHGPGADRHERRHRRDDHGSASRRRRPFDSAVQPSFEPGVLGHDGCESGSPGGVPASRSRRPSPRSPRRGDPATPECMPPWPCTARVRRRHVGRDGRWHGSPRRRDGGNAGGERRDGRGTSTSPTAATSRRPNAASSRRCPTAATCWAPTAARSGTCRASTSSRTAGRPPDTVNPSLWRQSQLVDEGACRGRPRPRTRSARSTSRTSRSRRATTGSTSSRPAHLHGDRARGLELYYQHRPRKPVVALVYSHSHVDHYGGAGGIVDEADVGAGKVRVIAPIGFLEAAVGGERAGRQRR